MVWRLRMDDPSLVYALPQWRRIEHTLQRHLGVGDPELAAGQAAEGRLHLFRELRVPQNPPEFRHGQPNDAAQHHPDDRFGE